MKKSIVFVLFVAAFSSSSIPSFGQSTAGSQTTVVRQPQPQYVGGANPRPQYVGGANPRPQTALPGWVVAVLTFINL